MLRNTGPKLLNVLDHVRPNHSLGLARKPAMQDDASDSTILQSLNQSLNILANLRKYGDGSQPSYPLNSTAPNPSCCDHTHLTHSQNLGKSEPLSPAQMTGIGRFVKGIQNLKIQKQTAYAQRHPDSQQGPRLGFLERIEEHGQTILSRDKTKDSLAPDNVQHDMDILVSETLADVLGKLTKHPNKSEVKREAQNILQVLSSELGANLQNSSEYHAFFHQNGRRLTGEQLLAKMYTFMRFVPKGEKYTDTKVPHSPTEAYEAAASLMLRMNKPAHDATRVVGKRRDHHNHIDPYDWNGDHHHITPMDWQLRMARKYDVQNVDVMPIPHEITTYNGRDRKTMNQRVRFGYYDDRRGEGDNRQVETRFLSHDRSHIVERNRLDEEIRKALNFCATGLPVVPSRLAEVRKIAAQYATNLVRAQLKEGRKDISVDFGEITGYKPAVPQPMLGDTDPDTGRRLNSTQEDKAAIQQAFTNGSALIMTEIFKNAAEAMAKEVKDFADKGGDVSGLRTKTRIVFHADALPTDEATNRPGNVRRDGRIQEATVMQNIVDYARKINDSLAQSNVSFPDGVVHEHHLQAAHLMGASVAENNYMDGARATELHRAFNTFREECDTLRVTTDSSWLTASARAINRGMSDFFKRSGDTDLQEIGDMLKTIDDLSNNAFMFLHGGERYFEQKMLNGDHSDKSVLDMAMMRAAQKKAVTTYHTALGQLYDKINDTPDLPNRLRAYVEQGVSNDTDLVEPGNYPGLFYKLAVEHKPGRQDATPIVWGTDNLTPGEARSGDLKMLQYISQHGGLEIILDGLGKYGKVEDSAPTLSGDSNSNSLSKKLSTYAKISRTFLGGTAADRAYLGSGAKVDPDGIFDGHNPADASTGETEKPAHPDAMFNLRAPQDPRFPWSAKRHKDVRVPLSGEELVAREKTSTTTQGNSSQ